MGTDEKEILERTGQVLAAWQRGDAKGAVANLAEDAVRVGAFGDIQHGRAEIEAAYQKLFSGPMKGARVRWEPTVHFLASDVAACEGQLTIQPPDGAPISGYALDLWKKRDGRWWLVEGHPKFYPPRR